MLVELEAFALRLAVCAVFAGDLRTITHGFGVTPNESFLDQLPQVFLYKHGKSLRILCP